MTKPKAEQSRVLFRNYDLYETEGVGGKDRAPSPGAGLYQNMQKYKSVSDFLKKKKKRKRQQRKMALLLAIAFPELVEGKKFKSDENDMQDPYEDQDITPLAPISPAEVAPIGMLDGIYPKSDLDGKSIENLYYGRLETHEYAADDGTIGDTVRKHVDKFGTIRYYDKNGKLHHDSGPSEIYTNGTKYWHRHGVQHRDGGLPAVDEADGHKEWWVNGLRHREGDLPAIIWNDGRKDYFVEHERHREEGPAIEYANGDTSYFYHGEKRAKQAPKLVHLWNGQHEVIVDWTGLVIRLAHQPNTQDNTIWVYSENYEPLYRPQFHELQNGKMPAATLHDINEGLPPPETGLKGDTNNPT